MKVGPKVVVQDQSNSKQISDVWNYFEKVPMPSKDKGVTIVKTRCLFCRKLYSYTQGGCTSHLGRHKKTCAAYKKKVAQKETQSLLNYAPSNADDSGTPAVPEVCHEET